jgi:hypothetical protein
MVSRKTLVPFRPNPAIAVRRISYTGWRSIAPVTAAEATVKWSRDNGSVTFPILAVSDQMVSLAHLGRDGRFTLSEGDWVEAIDDDHTLEGRVSNLLRVEKVYREEQKVLLSVPLSKVGRDLSRHPFLRRWDQQPGKYRSAGKKVVVRCRLARVNGLSWKTACKFVLAKAVTIAAATTGSSRPAWRQAT